jgi:hypothetical protein
VLLFGSAVLNRTAGLVMAAGVLVLFGFLWFALPLTHPGRHPDPEEPTRPGDQG